MKKYLFLTFILLECIGAYAQHARLIDSGAMPQVFAPGAISTPYTEWSVSFSPDGKTAYSSMGDIYWTIIASKNVNGVWQQPEVASFSGRYRDTDPFVTPDGNKVFFISNRPQPGVTSNVPQPVEHLWYAERQQNGDWGNLTHLDSAINLNGVNNYAPSVSIKGTVYYCSRRKELTGMQSFFALWQGDHYGRPQQLHIPGAAEIQDPFIAPDESYLVYLDGNSLCISFYKNGSWTPEEKLGPEVNNGDSPSSPHVSADGKTLYYSSNRIQGFYKRDLKKPALTYAELLKENNSLFNSRGNILMIPIHLSN